MNSSAKPTEVYKKNLPLDKTLTLSFLNGVKMSVNEVVPAMLKELNEIWKFFMYFMKMMSHFSEAT